MKDIPACSSATVALAVHSLKGSAYRSRPKLERAILRGHGGREAMPRVFGVVWPRDKATALFAVLL